MTGPLTVQALVDKLTARQAAADAEIADLRDRMAKPTDALVAAERARERWAGTRETVLALVAEEHPDQAAATRLSPPPTSRSSPPSPPPPGRCARRSSVRPWR
ncbi:hypothetical protein [Streptomyces mirabilis]|uniref:hypothetical protein n=1 Tax=Streptomyces mirabilis TaxID=68239 RepID=UPI00369AF2E4